MAADLAQLRGPVAGMVELPLRLFWSGDRVFDLGDPEALRLMYEAVLREAIHAEELAEFLNGGMLITVWPELCLPSGARQAWEDRHPALRAGAAAA